MKEEEPKIVITKAVKKNIYVYDREVPDEEVFKESRSRSTSSSNKSAIHKLQFL
jgi:hypothetical protein